uniref:Uncharacterized protein n=2 Tax=Candidatus Kentrum sp. MB TaxID=2138164 RepID=A0A450WYF8_9GAMM|nr:MAG: hypothetical protein BECKMB1821G_GA0114241_100128 [Candidatus Kentron sp. MB]VFK74380.1 MAG: hypothetical protein BECKMB1821H_GA0114242_100428 [Candidatus Kentron sp. MB]
MIGLIGGITAPWFSELFGITAKQEDPVAIANTFIVFTTMFFVGITALLVIISYFFTHQFIISKELKEAELVNGLKEKLQSEEGIATELAKAALLNPKISEEIKKLITEVAVDSKPKENQRIKKDLYIDKGEIKND